MESDEEEAESDEWDGEAKFQDTWMSSTGRNVFQASTSTMY